MIQHIKTFYCNNMKKEFKVFHRLTVSKFCMDAGFTSVVEIGQYWWLKTLENNSLRRLVVNTVFQEVTNHHNQKDGFKETRDLDPVLEITTSCLYGKHGIEIRIWSLSEDNSQSWVRISHGSNKFVIDSNTNDTEVPEDQHEEQSLKLNVKDFAYRSKAKAKPQCSGDSRIVAPLPHWGWTAT